MENPITPPPIPPVPHERKPSQVMSWFGFGISLFVLLMILAVVIFVLTLAANRGDAVGGGSTIIGSLLMLAVLVCGPLWLIGLVFSIVGLTSALKHFTRKWPSMCGIVFCGLCPLCFFLVPAIGAICKPDSGADPMEMEFRDVGREAPDPKLKGSIVLYFEDPFDLKCYDCRNGKEENPAKFNVLISFGDDFETWLQMNDVDKDAKFVIVTDDDVDYSYVVRVIDTLKQLGITDYKVVQASEVL